MNPEVENKNLELCEFMFFSIRLKISKNLKHISNFLSFILTRLLAIGTFAISVPIFINRTSQAEYGIVAIGFSLLGLSALLDMGIGYVITQSVGRRLARSGRAHPQLFNKVLWTYLGIAVGISAFISALVLLMPGISFDERIFFAWLSLVLPFLAISGSVAAVFLAYNDLVYLNSSRFTFEIAKGLSLLLSALLFANHSAVGPVLLIFAAMRATMDLVFLKRRLGYAIGRPNFSKMRKVQRLIAIGYPAVGSVLLVLPVNISDKILIARWFSKEDVAHYSLAFDLNTKAYLLMYALNSALFATMIKNHATKRGSKSQIRVGLLGVVFVSLFYYLPFSYFSEPLISIWVNPEVAAATAPLASVMAFASIAYLLGNVFENALLAKGRPRPVFFVYLCAVGIYFLCVVLLPSLLGVIGFVWAYLTMCLIFCVGAFYAYTRISQEKSELN